MLKLANSMSSMINCQPCPNRIIIMEAHWVFRRESGADSLLCILLVRLFALVAGMLPAVGIALVEGAEVEVLGPFGH